MSQADLKSDLKASINDAEKLFEREKEPAGNAFDRHLRIAAIDLYRVRPRVILAELALVAEQSNYAAPADLIRLKSSEWGKNDRRKYKPWEKDYPGVLPVLSVIENTGTRELWLDPAPTEALITQLGAEYKYFYFANHLIAETPAATTVPAGDRGLLILRAQAEAMKELAMRNVTRPVALRDGMSQGAKNGTPAAMHDQMMKEFERMGGMT